MRSQQSNKVNFMQYPDDSLNDENEGFLNVVLENLKTNLSIQYFRLFEDEDKQKEVWPLIQKELEMNSNNEQTYLEFCKREADQEWLPIEVDKIKLSLKFYVMI